MESTRQATENPEPIEIRKATPSDVEAIASLHTAVWHETYRSLAPPTAIEMLTGAVRLERWRNQLNAPVPGRVTLVAEHDDVLTGFGQVGPASHELYGERLEIKFLYVAKEYRRWGISRRLMKLLALAATEQRAAGLALGVVNANLGAIEFYERLGGCRIGRYTDPGPVWRSDNFIYAWDDLGTLATLRI